MSAAVLVAESEPETRVFLERELPRDGFKIARLGGPFDLVLAGDVEVAGRWVERAPVIVLGRERAGAVDASTRFAAGATITSCGRSSTRSSSSGSAPCCAGYVLAIPRSSTRRRSRSTCRTRVVRVLGRPVRLAQKEYELLLTLAREPDRVFTKAELLRDVWGYRVPGRTRTLDSHASRLRRKLREAGGGAELVDNVWGVGYRLRGLPTT